MLILFCGIFLAVLSPSLASSREVSDTTATPSIYNRCTSNNDCQLERTYCKVNSPTCGRGSCQCIPGHIFDTTSQSCKRVIAGVGTRCDPSTDFCTGKNVFCYQDTQTCSCPASYQEGLEGDCVPLVMTKSYGAPCDDDMECYYSLHCLDGRCGCRAGFKSHQKTKCVKKAASDSCSSDQDCYFVSNSACVNGVCKCNPGYNNITYWTGVGQEERVTEKYVHYKYRVGVTNTACVGQNDSPQPEGTNCTPESEISGDSGTANSSPVYCQQPYICTSCGRESADSKERYVCARPPLPLMDSASSMTLELLTLFTSALIIFTFVL